MKKMICFLMLLASITGIAFAQNNTTKTDKTFELPPNHAHRRFFIDLDKGNKMQIEVSAMEDLKPFLKMDSVIRVFLKDLEPLKDSLGDELLSRLIDYIADSSGRKKIRIQQFKPKGSSFLVQDGEVASLKLEQDTINFIGTVSIIAKYTLRKAFTTSRTYRISFYVNNLSDLVSYTDGRLNQKMQVLQDHVNNTWVTTAKKSEAYLKEDPSIKARLPKGYVAGGNYLNIRFSVDVQNYKNYFVPSFSLGAGLIISKSFFKRDIVLSWDPNFFFSKDSAGSLKTYRNDFLTLTWGQGLIRDNEPRKESHLLFIMSLGYLVHRSGNYFDKNTFRMGAGRLSLFEGKTKIEPAMYFNHFFKGVTPGLRLIQSF
ncbi:hypothetical protein OCK74_05490 [Chitinophagaceae bacterium LB-8]|uniref:Uncharacterized protein n=1 Tax=Paraflavisolibacter caeni TaxID=2982496 RepID=A0A9X3BH76_9BACT|nr:hypothetical protein [Paraflavisolibacter caeni]MCU7548558.1 hypothetical protein [Paraflavisolibacter caeni]